eukprot:CAMPEP_0181407968 /NCGR_PEP_ID=MMETSP1110-20121109/6052_1 /TAXON_ID=174948 /ORGANISM="Symbiodinium sp., Strain CCMP421" /LENGTH=40 /DNA_ID= /DNA_START= /DNA_END= /DNA_ORIENTATION=
MSVICAIGFPVSSQRTSSKVCLVLRSSSALTMISEAGSFG